MDRLNNGKCPQCGGDRDSEWITCSSCREKSKVYRRGLTPAERSKGLRRYRAKCRKEKICYGCGSALREDSHILCAKCRRGSRKRCERYRIAKALAETKA